MDRSDGVQSRVNETFAHHHYCSPMEITNYNGMKTHQMCNSHEGYAHISNPFINFRRDNYPRVPGVGAPAMPVEIGSQKMSRVGAEEGLQGPELSYLRAAQHNSRNFNCGLLSPNPVCHGHPPVRPSEAQLTPLHARNRSDCSAGMFDTREESLEKCSPSNSNTTMSCISGNSTSVNVGGIDTCVIKGGEGKDGNQTENIQGRQAMANLRESHLVDPSNDRNLLKLTGKDEENKKRKKISLGTTSQEFLPICDALFNIISLAAYFCDIVFDLLTVYSWYKIAMCQFEANNFLYFEGSSRLELSEEDEESSNSFLQWSLISLVCIITSAVLCQILSYKWYKESEKRGQMTNAGNEIAGPPPPCSQAVLVAMHISFCGVLWRYFKLFIPVDLNFVKNEVRDLCLLRLVHAFCEATPMLLIQLYLVWQTKDPETITDFTKVSCALSLFNICWAMASFSKNVRKQNVHKLVLTWLGVVCQFLWRIGTISSRVVALTVYATFYSYYVFLVLILHWFSMLMWLISPKNIFHGEKMSGSKKLWYANMIAVVYTFCYINVQEKKSQQIMIIYYVTMFLENSLLYGVSLIAIEGEVWYIKLTTCLVFISFGLGIAFMCIYYRYCHVKRLNYAYDATTTASSSFRESEIPSSATENLEGNSSSDEHTPDCLQGRVMKTKLGAGMRIPCYSTANKIIAYRSKESAMCKSRKRGADHDNRYLVKNQARKKPNLTGTGLSAVQCADANLRRTNGQLIPGHQNAPGVFNCRFHPAMKRKKKKPTSFVPPPSRIENRAGNSQELVNQPDPGSEGSGGERHASNSSQSIPSFAHYSLDQMASQSGDKDKDDLRAAIAAYDMNRSDIRYLRPDGWKRPLSITIGSENEGSVGSRVDIQQKLQEKKQQQLAELKEIEEEIKQGKLTRPHISEIPESIKAVKHPIPFEKKQPWFHSELPMEVGPRPPVVLPPIKDFNELVLDPQYLMYSSNQNSPLYDNAEWPTNFYESVYPTSQVMERSHKDGVHSLSQTYDYDSKFIVPNEMSPAANNEPYFHPRHDSIYKSYRAPSDIDSQMSLPRSYTLPREFIFKRKARKAVKNENFLPSTNSSSDGDVDSGEEGNNIYSDLKPYHIPFPVGQTPVIHHNKRTAAAAAQARKNHKLHETKL